MSAPACMRERLRIRRIRTSDGAAADSHQPAPPPRARPVGDRRRHPRHLGGLCSRRGRGPWIGGRWLVDRDLGAGQGPGRRHGAGRSRRPGAATGLRRNRRHQPDRCGPRLAPDRWRPGAVAELAGPGPGGAARRHAEGGRPGGRQDPAPGGGSPGGWALPRLRRHAAGGGPDRDRSNRFPATRRAMVAAVRRGPARRGLRPQPGADRGRGIAGESGRGKGVLRRSAGRQPADGRGGPRLSRGGHRLRDASLSGPGCSLAGHRRRSCHRQPRRGHARPA